LSTTKDIFFHVTVPRRRLAVLLDDAWVLSTFGRASETLNR
jgi:hypothetical protein